MTEAKKLSNRLKQTWLNTNTLNWDVLEREIKSAKNMIDKGNIDPDLIDTYLTLSEAFKCEFGGNNDRKKSD